VATKRSPSSPPTDDHDRDDLTIDELGRLTGMTVRNLRAHHERGLLPPPTLRGRTGYYGPEHVERVRLIQEMQAAGFNLKAIERLLEASDGAGDEALEFGRAVLSSVREEASEVAEVEELEARLGGPFDRKTQRRAERLGLVRPLGDGTFELPNPTLVRAGEELISMGVSVPRALAVGERVARHTRAIAEAFVELFTEDVMGDKRPSELSAAEWVRLRTALDRLGPLARDVVDAVFRQAMSGAVERELRDTLRR
jgi:DNA-binding transcriptional MerR regulator